MSSSNWDAHTSNHSDDETRECKEKKMAKNMFFSQDVCTNEIQLYSYAYVCVRTFWLLIEEYKVQNEKEEGESDQYEAIIITCD